MGLRVTRSVTETCRFVRCGFVPIPVRVRVLWVWVWVGPRIPIPYPCATLAMWITLLSEAHTLCHLLQQINIYFYFYLTLTLAYFLHVLAQTASAQFLCHELDKNDYLLFRLGPLSFTS